MATSRRIDRLATAVFERAENTGQRVTVELAKTVVAELDPEASLDLVYTTARAWQRAINTTRQLATR